MREMENGKVKRGRRKREKMKGKRLRKRKKMKGKRWSKAKR